MIDEGDIEDPQSAFATCRIQVFTAMLQREDLWFVETRAEGFEDIFAGMFVSVFELAVMFFDVFSIIFRVGDLMKAATEDGLWFGLLGDDDTFESMFTGTDPAVFSDEVCRAGTLHEQLRHDGIVIVVERQVAIGA